jgi:hypothetical protein
MNELKLPQSKIIMVGVDLSLMRFSIRGDDELLQINAAIMADKSAVGAMNDSVGKFCTDK